MNEPPIYVNAALLRLGRDHMVYLDFRLRTPDNDDDLDDLPEEVSLVVPDFIARQLSEELDRLLSSRPTETISPVEDLPPPDVRAEVESDSGGDDGNGGRRQRPR